ncbi:hypothetical protein N7535_007007 [Penicillium sp. DV-2018c]|nr:hypothetical protein N7461_006902 [Penicillium sp. DV-2018c]KAJ5567701.1 hypothetical protein N7535_007007 [Penicillium sp. DV-2018c]
MAFRTLSPGVVMAGVTSIMRESLEGFRKLDSSGWYTPPTYAVHWSVQTPILAACAVVDTTGAILLAAPGLATAPVLSAIGFTTSGIQAGSAAAAAHSGIGNIVAGSAMAIERSAGAGGYGLAIVNGVVQLVGAVMAFGSAVWIKIWA